MIHYDCLKTFKSKNFETRASYMTNDDLDINNFQCPLCKMHSNCILPPVEEIMKIEPEELREITEDDPEKNLLNIYLDLINIMNHKILGELKPSPSSILPCDLAKVNNTIVNISRSYVNHCIQLTDVKGISWALNETPKLKSILKMVESLIRFDTEEDAHVDLSMPGCFSENFLKVDLSDFVTYLAITEYYDITKNELEFNFTSFQELMKIGYALVLLQISARLIYEKQGFRIENFHEEITFESLTQLVETMDAGLEVGGQPIETSTKYIEGSLSYLRKMVILIHILTDRTQEFKKEIKKLSNPASTCEPEVELSTLLNILGFEIQDLSNNFAFINIIKEVQSIEAPKHQFCANLLEYFNQKCELTKEVTTNKEKDAEMQDEEEKIDPENDKKEPRVEIPDDIIPTNLYLLTPDYYFTLLPLDSTLEQLTKKYYKKECSLCHKLTKRGSICLI